MTGLLLETSPPDAAYQQPPVEGDLAPVWVMDKVPQASLACPPCGVAVMVNAVAVLTVHATA